MAVGVIYLINNWVLKELYPNAEIDYYQFVDLWKLRSKIYEATFAGLFSVLFLNTKGFIKAFACAMMVLTVSSFIDKTVFGFTQYLKSDIPLVVLSVILSIIVYVRERKKCTK